MSTNKEHFAEQLLQKIAEIENQKTASLEKYAKNGKLEFFYGRLIDRLKKEQDNN